MNFTIEDCQVIAKYYPDYGSDYCRELLKEKGFTVKQIIAKASRLKIKRTSRDEEYKSVYEKYFNLNDPFSIYLMGFTWADGHVSKTDNRITIKLLQSDAYFLDKILGDNWKRRVENKNHEKCKPVLVFRLSNVYAANFLRENDYTIKSGASADKILSKIPKHLQHYWWRGYLDGDGSFNVNSNKNRYRIMFYSVYEQDWNFFTSLDSKYKITRMVRKTGSKSSTVTISGLTHSFKLGSYIYRDFELDRIGLERKFLKFRQIADRYNIYYVRCGHVDKNLITLP